MLATVKMTWPDAYPLRALSHADRLSAALRVTFSLNHATRFRRNPATPQVLFRRNQASALSALSGHWRQVRISSFRGSSLRSEIPAKRHDRGD